MISVINHCISGLVCLVLNGMSVYCGSACALLVIGLLHTFAIVGFEGFSGEGDAC